MTLRYSPHLARMCTVMNEADAFIMGICFLFLFRPFSGTGCVINSIFFVMIFQVMPILKYRNRKNE